MCHGTFDIVHPGHIRHLLYAKSKGDILVASLTADAHIAKANFRPFVPQELRAFNLAALEMRRLRRHRQRSDADQEHRHHPARLFRQGLRVHQETACIRARPRRKTAVEAYGGEIIFTPGDIVYSSSNIIETEPPAIATEKLMALLEAEGLDFDDLRAALDKLHGHPRARRRRHHRRQLHPHALIGGMTKTPTMSVRFENRTDFVGGAGIVAKHLKRPAPT